MTARPEIVTFHTDFGIEFGTFICFDVLFKEPALTLTRSMRVTDVVFPAAWFSEIPFLTGKTEFFQRQLQVSFFHSKRRETQDKRTYHSESISNGEKNKILYVGINYYCPTPHWIYLFVRRLHVISIKWNTKNSSNNVSRYSRPPR